MKILSVLTEIKTTLESLGIDITLDDIISAVRYLKKYGYIEYLENITINDIISGIKLFQGFFHLTQDGILGPKTFRAMNGYRCAVSDITSEQLNVRKWGLRRLTYQIVNRDRDLSANEWDKAIQEAFSFWSEVCNLQFTKVNSNANIRIDVGSGRKDNFDGPSGTLAWAQLPPQSNYRGQLLMKFDIAETWIINPRYRGILLLNVACHEIGHILGLGHSKVQSALMAPYYSPNVEKPQNDDIRRIQSLYGRPTSTPTPTPVPTPQDLTINISGKIDSISIPGFRVTKLG